MTGSKENTSLPKEVDTRVEPTAFEANSKQRCVLCDNDHYCYLFSAKDQIIKAVCHRTDQAPEGWDRTGTAKDGRGIFTKRGAPQTRKYFPGYITLIPKAIGGEQSWDAPFWREAAPEWKETGIADATAKEQVIHYLYPDPIDGKPLGRVERMQWSDRRKVYSYQGRKPKTKLIIPQHWVGTPEEGSWKPKKGERVWPLYREQEAQEEVLKGGIVFLVGGEQAVEAYRSLGLVATTCQGGEANYRQVIDRLDNAFEVSKKNGNRPLLAIHPDFDLTGEKQFAEGALRECYSNKIPAIAIEPLELWPECPQGGDIHDYLLKTQLKPEIIIKTLETCISEAVDRQELEIRGRQQRARWQAPESWQGELGSWKENSAGDDVFRPLTDFDLQIERELISEDGGGLQLQVKRTDDRAQRRVFIKSQDYSSTAKFIDAIKKGLGGGVICNLNNYQLQALIRVRLHEYRSTRQGKAYRLIDRVGQQADGTWVFKQCQFSRNGESTDENRSLWVWNQEITNSDRDIKPTIIAPQSPTALKTYIEVVKRATGSNFIPTLLVMGYGAAGVHYQEIIEEEGAFPVGNIYGDPGGGKTSAALCALALVGQHKVGVMREISISAAYERLKLAGGLTHCLDDPKRDEHLDEFLKGFYNGKSRVVRGKESGFNTQEPHSPLIVTSNHAVGESSAATQSRLFRLFFPKTGDGESDAWRELPRAMDEASGALTQIIAMGYPKADVYACEAELMPFLPEAHARIAKSLALVLVYAKRLAELAGIDQGPIVAYVKDVLCAQSNDPDESGDSLRDFIEKLFLLESEAKVGPWNMKWVEKRDGSRSLAIYLPGVWKAMDKGFSLAYNRKIIESLIRAKGITQSGQKFHLNEDVSRAWERAKLTGNNQYLNSVETQTRQCFELPAKILKNYAEIFEDEKADQLRSTRDFGTFDEWEEPQTQSGRSPLELSELIFKNSTQINSDQLSQKTGINEHQDFSRVDRVDRELINKNQPIQPLEPIPSNGSKSELIRVDRVDQVFTNTPPESENLEPVPIVIGNIVVPFATAVWVRAKESTKLPTRSLRPSLKDAKEIPLEALPPDLWAELLGPARVTAISKDGLRFRTINQSTGRTSVFYRNQVAVLPQEVPNANG
jgi:hypothetical protein